MSRWKVPVALAVAFGAIAWLLASGVARNDVYVASLAQMDWHRAEREPVRVMGFVAEGSIHEVPGELVTTFSIRDEEGTRTLPVRYAGVTPGLFREGTSVITLGRLGTDGTFHATELMTKCPSKYEGVETPHGPSGPGSAEAAPST